MRREARRRRGDGAKAGPRSLATADDSVLSQRLYAYRTVLTSIQESTGIDLDKIAVVDMKTQTGTKCFEINVPKGKKKLVMNELQKMLPKLKVESFREHGTKAGPSKQPPKAKHNN